jgi:hypothetical protein
MFLGLAIYFGANTIELGNVFPKGSVNK